MMNATTIPSISASEPGEGLGRCAQFVRAFLSDCAGVSALEEMLREDTERLAGPRHGRHRDRAGRAV